MNRTLLIIFVFAFGGIAGGQSNSWRGLLPLQSTRVDVERLFGKQITRAYAPPTYKIDEVLVEVTYSEGKCDQGWNVPKDAVLSFTVNSTEDERKTPEELGITDDH